MATPDSRDEAGIGSDLDLPDIPGGLTGAADSITDADLISLSSVDIVEALADLDIGEQVRNIDDVNTPTLVGSFSAKLDGETSSPLLYDVVLTSSGNYAIVTDCWNHCVKAFDLRTPGSPCKCVYRVKDDHCPLCITRLSHPERVAFTLHHRAEIHILDVHEEEGCVLTFHSVLRVRHKYRGITTLSASMLSSTEAEAQATSTDTEPERFAVTAPKEIHILSLDGEILQVIAPALCGLPLLNDAIYLSTTPSNDLVVSDVGSRRVLCVKTSGRLRWFHPSLELPSENNDDPDSDCPNGTDSSFKGIQWPLGVATDDAGRVLVCDLELHSVVILSPGGAASRLLLTETESLKYPRGLTVHNGRLCLTQDDNVKIFSY